MLTERLVELAGGRRLRTLLLVGALALLAPLATQVRAQEGSTLRADIVSVAEAEYPTARALLNLDDESGGQAPPLTAENIVVTVNGQSVTVQSVELASSASAPLEVVLLMDVSGSMAGEPIVQAKEAAKAFLRALDPNDRVAIVTFADTVTPLLDYTTDRAAAEAAINGLVAQGNTALYDATAAAAVKSGSAASIRRAVILLSDGAQDGVPTVTTRDAAIAAAAGVGVPFFAIAQGTNIDRPYLQEIASRTRGRYLEAPNPSDLTALYAGIGALLRSQYTIAFDASTAAGLTDAAVRVEVTLADRTASAEATFTPSAAFAPPPVVLSGIAEGASITEPTEVTATLGGAAQPSRVAFYVDHVNVFEDAEPPYSFVYDPAGYGTDEHVLEAVVQIGTQTVKSDGVDFSSVAPVPEPAEGPPVVPIALVAGGVAVLALLIVLIKRRKPRERLVPTDQRIVPWSTAHRKITGAPAELEAPVNDDAPFEEIGDPLGMLISRRGNDLGREYVVGGRPVSIGSAKRCGVRIDDERLAAEEARIWVRNGTLVLHKLTKLTAMALDGTVGGWTILEPGDSFDVGEHRFEFRMLPSAAPVDEEPSEAAPRTTDTADTGAPPDIFKERPGPRPLRPLPDGPAAGQTPRLLDMMPRESSGGPEPDEQAS